MVKSINAKFLRPLLLLICFALFCCLSGCGNGDGTTPTPTPTPTSTTNAASLDLLASSQALNSSGTPTVTLTAIVKDSSNRALADQVVSFSATSGTLIVNSTTTDASGQATATLSMGEDKSNRIITVTSSCGSISNTNTVSVVGTTIDVSGQDSVGYGSTATYTITLKDSAAVGIASQTVTITSQYNTLSTSTITTNSSGQGTVTLTASGSGVDTLTATALGATGQKAVTVNSAAQNLAFTTPAASAELPISTLIPVSVSYSISGVPQSGQTVSFTTDRGTLDNTSVQTNGSGIATVNVSSTTVGITTITASVGGVSASLNVEFIATTPASMTLQADPSSISTNIGTSTTQQSILTATVRDAQNNLVKNQKINFTLITDPSGGYLSPSTATTDSAGRATVLYIAGSTDSGTNGVKIQAVIQGTAITKATTLTVSGIAIFISIGTGPKITQVSDQTYQKNYDVLVTDSGGHAVSNVVVTAILIPVAYLKGYWFDSGSSTLGYIWTPTLTSTHNTSLYSDSALAGYNYCLNEDLQYWNDPLHTAYLLNGSLDPGEDYNGNGQLDPGTIAAVSPSTVTTDSNGSGTFGVIYTKAYAMWVFVRLNVTVNAGGTEGKASTTFLLPYMIGDYGYPAPKQPDSPFGTSITCHDTY